MLLDGTGGGVIMSRFTGCNSIWAVFILINMVTRSVQLFEQDSSGSEAAGVFIIIE